MDQVQIVTTNAGHHVRIVASNGEPIAFSEVHPDRRDAEHAVVVLARAFGVKFNHFEDLSPRVYIQYVDERI